MEFDVNDQTYVVEKISAMKQFHIIRRLAPVLAGLAPSGDVAKLQGMMGAKAEEVVPRLAEALAKINDEDSEFVLYGLMAAVKRKEKQGLGYAPLVVGGKLMYQNLTLPEMLQIAAKSAQFNMRDFLSALPQASSSAVPTPSVQ